MARLQSIKSMGMHTEHMVRAMTITTDYIWLEYATLEAAKQKTIYTHTNTHTIHRWKQRFSIL